MPKLTKTMVQEAGPGILWDSEVKGFGAKVGASSISFILDYRHGGIGRRMVLGRLGELTVDAARREASRLKLEVRAGSDPLMEIRAKRKPQGLTVADISGRWLKANAKQWSTLTHAGYRRIMRRNVLAKLGDRILTSITRAEWAVLFGDIDSAAVAGLARRAVGSMCTWAREQGLIEQAIDLPKRQPRLDPRSRVVSDDEIRRMWAATAGLRGRQGAFARYMVLSCLRSDAAAQTRSEWLDGGMVTYPGQTTGLKRQVGQRHQGHKVFLNAWALDQLELPSGSELMFGFVRPARVLESLRDASGCTDWKWHDLRRSARSWMAKHGISRDAAETCLGHKVIRDETEAAYLIHNFEREAEAAFHAWQRHLQALVEGSIGGIVVSMR